MHFLGERGEEGVAVNGWTAVMLDGIPQIYGATAFTAAFRQFSQTSPHDFTWEIIPSHFEIDRGSIEKTAIFSRLKAERCNCRFRHDRSPMILFVSLVNLCLHWLNVWLTACAEFLAERERETMISLSIQILILQFVRSKFNVRGIRFDFSEFCQWIF